MPNKEVQANSRLTSEQHPEIYRACWRPGLGDQREESLHCQGSGWFQLAGTGHEAMAALGRLLKEEDYLCPFYRDRAPVLAKGLTTYELALNFQQSVTSSGGRQLPSHFPVPERKTYGVYPPVGAHLLPACGIAWDCNLTNQTGSPSQLLGEGSARQRRLSSRGCLFALEKNLPILFC